MADSDEAGTEIVYVRLLDRRGAQRAVKHTVWYLTQDQLSISASALFGVELDTGDRIEITIPGQGPLLWPARERFTAYRFKRPEQEPQPPRPKPMAQMVGKCDRCPARGPLFMVPSRAIYEPFLCEACAKEVADGSQRSR